MMVPASSCSELSCKMLLATSPPSGGAMAGSGSSQYEALLGLVCGGVFGAVSPIVGHPFDTVKTRMQAVNATAGKMTTNSTVSDTVQLIYRQEGWRGFYRGFLPPLIGSMAFRSVLFSAYSGTFAACQEVPTLSEPIPYTGGLRPSVLLGAMAASVARACIESPFDYLKVRYMVGQDAFSNTTTVSTTSPESSLSQKVASHNQNSNQPAGRSAKTTTTVLSATKPVPSVSAATASSMTALRSVGQLYHGFGATLWRTMGLLGSFFVLCDYSVRYMPQVVTAPVWGPFFKGGICATAAWVIAFPLETAKSVIQTDTTGRYNKMTSNSSALFPGSHTFRVLYLLYQEFGIKGWYRGFAPGASRSFVANGASMMVYASLQDYIRT